MRSIFRKGKGFTKLNDTYEGSESSTPNEGSHKFDALKIFNKDSKKVSKDSIDKAMAKASESMGSIDHVDLLASAVRPIRMWVRDNKTRLPEINQTIDEFERIAQEAKDFKDSLPPTSIIDLSFLPKVQEAIKSYRKSVIKELRIARELYDHINGTSSSNNQPEASSSEIGNPTIRNEWSENEPTIRIE